jgi:hypothetical protein
MTYWGRRAIVLQSHAHHVALLCYVSYQWCVVGMYLGFQSKGLEDSVVAKIVVEMTMSGE